MPLLFFEKYIILFIFRAQGGLAIGNVFNGGLND